MTLGIEPHDMETVREILRANLPPCEVLAFGSRANGTARRFSDLDLLVRGDEALPDAVLVNVVWAFQESELPFSVDVVDWHRTEPSFREKIAPDAVPFEM